MKIGYLVTTCNKNKDEIIVLVKRLNVKGCVYVGNQLANNDDVCIYKENNLAITIFNMQSKGVSLNRNYLLNKCDCDIVTFLDDDVAYLDSSQEKVEEELKKMKYNESFRFNCVSENKKRKIKQVHKNNKLSLLDVSSFGVWGEFFYKGFLMENNILFNENIGPGCYVNHGEDTVFNSLFLKKGIMKQKNLVAFSIEQMTSTWLKDRDYKRDAFSDGFTNYLAFGKLYLLISVYLLIFKMNFYENKLKRIEVAHLFRKGRLSAKRLIKNLGGIQNYDNN